MTTKKLVDCFLFYNELDLLNYRLNVLDRVIDYFIIVESTHTFVGKEKPLFFNMNKHLFDKFSDKIIHVIVDDFPNKDPNMSIAKDDIWTNEYFQRNAISRGLDRIHDLLNPTDFIIIADVDEIPDPNNLHFIKHANINIEINMLQMDFYYYNLNSKFTEQWYFCKIMSYKKYSEYKELNMTCNDIRKESGYAIEKGGWHLSYFGDASFIKNKIQNFSHQEFNNSEFTNESKIEEHIKTCTDLYDRPTEELRKIDIKDNTYLPPEYDTYLTKYYTV